MDFNTFVKTIPILESATLGGLEAHLKLIPESRKKINPNSALNSNTKNAAVLALFFPNKQGETSLLLTLRAAYKGTHGAQVSFPGGKPEKSDIDLKATALRECFEEVGIASKEIIVFKEMTPVYIPPSNFLMSPFLGYIQKPPTYTTNHEVSEIIEVPLHELLNDETICYTEMKTSYSDRITIPYFNIKNQTIWGATAMVLSEIKELIKSL